MHSGTKLSSERAHDSGIKGNDPDPFQSGAMLAGRVLPRKEILHNKIHRFKLRHSNKESLSKPKLKVKKA